MNKPYKIFKRLPALLLSLALSGLCATAVFATEPDNELPKANEEYAIPVATASPFVVDGNGELIDEADSSDAKLFYTVQTKNGNSFFLIIDKARSSQNVYMLSMVDENDLAEFIDKEETMIEEAALPKENELGVIATPTPEPVEEVQEPEEDMIPAYVAGSVMLFGVLTAYYLLKIRKKGNAAHQIADDSAEEYEEYETEEADTDN